MLFHRSVRWVAGILLALSLEPTRYGVPTVRAEAVEVPPALMISEGKTARGFPYLFGGISSNERDVMEQRAKGYNVQLVFAQKRGSFISDATVVIMGAKGAELVSLAVDGPWFYIQLPPGT